MLAAAGFGESGVPAGRASHARRYAPPSHLPEHSFADFNYVPKGLVAKTQLSGTPVFGIGIKYKIDDNMCFGGQTSWGLQRNNLRVFDNISNKDIVYSIDYWCFKKCNYF